MHRRKVNLGSVLQYGLPEAHVNYAGNFAIIVEPSNKVFPFYTKLEMLAFLYFKMEINW